MKFEHGGISFQSSSGTNALIWISVLPPNEMGPSRKILEDLEPLVRKNGWYFELKIVSSAKEFREYFSALERRVWQEGLRPLLHLDGHGSQVGGLVIGENSEQVPWSELEQILRYINLPLQNDLVVVTNVCFGLHVIMGIDISEPSPIHILIASQNEVKEGFLIDNSMSFYNDLFSTKNITTAFEQNFSEGGLTLFHSDRMLLTAIARYFRRSTMGSGGRARREKLVTKVVNETPIKDLKNARRLVKAAVKPSDQLVRDYVMKFLHGKSPDYAFDDLVRIARGERL